MKYLTSILARFRAPYSKVSPNNEDLLRIQNCARYCFGTPEGEILLKHLINELDLDGQFGCLPHDESVYKYAQQDVIKYLLALISED